MMADSMWQNTHIFVQYIVVTVTLFLLAIFKGAENVQC
jgi:hypothetical protein